MRSYPLDHRVTFYDLPPTATMAFRFHQGHKLLLFAQGHPQPYEGDLVEPGRWHHLPAGARVFVRLCGGLDSAPIVGALVLANRLDEYPSANGSNRVLELDLHPDRPPGQEPAEGELVQWRREHFQTLFVYWPRLPKVVYKRDA